MKPLREQIEYRCVHHRGVHHNETCKAGVNYNDLMRVDELGRTGCMLRLPCGGSTGTTRGHTVEKCDKYHPPTEEEIQAEIDEWERVKQCLMDDVSSCCNAPINKSQVIQDGEHKNHGPRYCSKCKRLVYMV